MTIDYFMNQPIEIIRELFEFFKQTDKLVIFDIGSCEGLDSIRYSKLFPNSKIFAFEPLKENVKKINANLLKYNITNVMVYKIALSNHIGQSIFYVSSGSPNGKEEKNTWDYGNKSSSLLAPLKTLEIFQWLKFKDKINVTTDTLLTFCNTHKIEQIDFVHLDVQGAELMVLEGAAFFISKIKMIWMEVENVDLYKNQPLKKDIQEFMLKKGFIKIKDTVNKISGDQLWINHKYVNKKL